MGHEQNGAPSLALVEAFERFWTHVGRAERDIRANGHSGRLPPICFGDSWDDDFAHAYQQIHTFLQQFWHQQCYVVPPGLAFRPIPLCAATAHEALMFFLNKPDELFGERGVLDSVEYRRIKADAMKEWEILANEATHLPGERLRDSTKMEECKILANKPSLEEEPEKTIKRRIKRSGREFTEDDVLLHAFLLEWHRCNTDEPNSTPVGNQPFIAEKLGKSVQGWNPPRVSRTMKRLMEGARGLGHLGPMRAYHRLCDTEQICGYLTNLLLKMGRKGFEREFQVENLDTLFCKATGS